jgi:hypothetical protein
MQSLSALRFGSVSKAEYRKGQPLVNGEGLYFVPMQKLSEKNQRSGTIYDESYTVKGRWYENDGSPRSQFQGFMDTLTGGEGYGYHAELDFTKGVCGNFTPVPGWKPKRKSILLKAFERLDAFVDGLNYKDARKEK